MKRIVKSSVIGAEREAYTFARWHRAGEKAVEHTGTPHTFVRPNTFMQNMKSFFAGTIKGQGAFYFPAKDSKTSFVDVRHIARVAAKVLTTPGHEGKAYTVTGPAALTYGQVAEALGGAIGKKVSYVDLPPSDFKKSMTGFGVPEWMADAMVDMARYTIEEGCAEVTGAVETVTGKRPIAFETYAKDFAADFR